MSENDIDKYRLPKNETLEHASKIAITQDKPIMLDYWCSSLDGNILMQHYGNLKKVMNKGRVGDLVTEADAEKRALNPATERVA